MSTATDRVRELTRRARALGRRAAGALGSHPPDQRADDAAATGPDPAVFTHQMLHELRSLELERLHLDGGRALSIGANGRWYFDWFEGAVGPVDEHIAIEAFEPMPDDLPPYVTWNRSTADRFEGVGDESVDLVFAGQTTEHLWAAELADFLLESHRVLRPGARLVLDSPNRLVTDLMLWSHGGHTVELAAEEITELVTLAGFDVESRRGLLVSRFDGRVLELDEGLDRGDLTVRRLRSGPDVLDDSFIWWIVAHKADRTPDRATLLEAVERVFWVNWPARVTRGIWKRGDPDTITVPAGATGPVATTLPFPIAAGDWSLGLDVEGTDPAPHLEVRVLDAGGAPLHVLPGPDASPTPGRLTWRFGRPELVFACSLQIVADTPPSDLTLRLPLDLRATSGLGVRAAG